MASKKYYYAVGRRKSSTAVVKLFPAGKGNYSIKNGEKTISVKEFFGGNDHLYQTAMYPFFTLEGDTLPKYDAEIVMKGGGIKGQADALKLAFARALIEYNAEFRGILKPHGLLKRDPRVKERKKFGLKKARKSPQWSKR